MSVADDRVLRLLKEARERLEVERKRRTEPIAIVGIGCRFPGGVSSPAQFWDLLVKGVDATSEVPLDRWDAEALYDADPTAPGKCYAKRGGFLDRIDGFEPEFFNISPREAVALDPQQRLLLEVAWEALENAGIPPSSLRESNSGVWVGLSLDDYASRSVSSGQLDRIDAYTALGNARSVAAGRIAYVLGLHGPVMQLDTACSSSLVAIHLACQSLRSGECDLALVGGVNLMSSPEASVALCKLQALSSDGRCKTFDASADGYGRGEGCGMVVLKTLSAAEANGDRIYAVIRGSAVNHDGPSNGLTAPNGLAQEAVIRTALANSGLVASDVAYVEAHGTGTLLGDPIEVLALNRVYGAGRAPEAPLYVGSVKTNLGHLEAAAGIAALIKTALCLSCGQLVPSLHCVNPNSKIPWQSLGIRVATKALSWPPHTPSSAAGVSSFGISGTNAHVIVSAAPVRVAPAADATRMPARGAELVVLSARTEPALKATVRRFRDHVSAHPELKLADLAYSAATTRTLLECRATLVVRTPQALLEALETLAQSDTAMGIGTAPTATRPRKLAWLFTGQGAQKLGMGRELYCEWTAFQVALDAAFTALNPHLRVPLSDVLWASPDSATGKLLDQTSFTQPALFAFEWALAALFISWGVKPDFVAGHSIGEITAACVAGIFSLEDAARLVCERGRLMQALPVGGAMLAIAATKGEVADVLGSLGARAVIAAVNAPSSVVISGEEESVASVAAHFAQRGVDSKRLTVSHAFHSALMDPMLQTFQAVAETLSYRTPLIPLVSNSSGELAGTEVASPSYWTRHARQAVRFSDGIEALHAAGVDSYLEIGPKAILLPLVAATLPASSPLLLSSGRASGAETEVALAALGQWLRDGGKVHWAGVFPDGGQRLELPSYAWQRERYWIDAPSVPRSGCATTGHPLLGVRLPAAGADALFELLLSTQDPTWLRDHTVAGRTLLPAAALLELLRAAAEEHRDGLPCEVSSVLLARPLVLAERGALRVQIMLSDDGSRAAVYSQAADAPAGSTWTLHATADLRDQPQQAPARLDIPALRRRCSEPINVTALYETLRSAGLDYGPAFRGVKRASRGRSEVLAEIELGELDGTDWGVHPALLDAALQSLAALLGLEQGLVLPFEVGRLVVYRLGASAAFVHARWAEPPHAERMVADLTLSDGAGEPIAEVTGLHLRRADLSALTAHRPDLLAGALYRLEWAALAGAPAPASASERWVVVATRDEPRAHALIVALREAGAGAERVEMSQLPRVVADHVVCLWADRGDAEVAVHAAEQGLFIAQALSGHESAPRLWWLMQGSVRVADDDVISVAGSCLWGLGRTIMQELPALRCTLLDFGLEEPCAELLIREAAAADGETQLAFRAGRRHVARLVRASTWLPASSHTSIRAHGTVLITGGLGAFGLELARSLVEHGARHLLLTGRRGVATPGESKAIGELERLGARVTVAALDVSDAHAVAAVLATVPAELPLCAVVHAAGVLDDGVLSEQTPARFKSVMAGKVLGAWHLHVLTQGLDLDAFVLVSSIAGTLGSAAQAGYAAANTFLDTLASLRKSQGLLGLSLAFGPAQFGLASALDAMQRARLTRQGLLPLSAEEVRRLFESSLARPEAELVAAGIDPRKLSKACGASVPPVWQALLRKRLPGKSPARSKDFVRELSLLSVEARRGRIMDLVREQVARTLSISSAGAVALDVPLKDLGLDSLTALELNNALARETGLKMPAALIFQQPTARTVAEHLIEQARSGPRAARMGNAAGQAQQFRADAILNAQIQRASPGAIPPEPEAVLLTGATGFLGAHLLSDLLNGTRAQINCHVRAPNVATGLARVIGNLRRYGLWQDDFASRLSILPGDLRQPRLGLDSVTWGRLAESLDAVYNNGALLGFVADYREMKPSHVDPTNEILRLAASGRVKAVHHVSSTVVFDSAAYRRQTITELMDPLESGEIYVGYSQCKWVSETLVRAAASRDIPVTIHRPDFIAGSGSDGGFNTADFLARLFKSIIEMGVMPGDLDLELYFSPVDYVSRCIVYLSLQPDSRGRAFHLQHPRGIHLEALGEILRSLGYQIRSVPYHDWVSRLEAWRDGPLAPLLPFLEQRWGPDQLTYMEGLQRQHRPSFSCDQTLVALQASGIECPSLDRQLIERYLRYFMYSGFIKGSP